MAPAVAAALTADVGTIARDTARRQARRLTLRVRNISCQGVITGSGFAVTHDVLVTNRHVLAGADALEVNTWNGRTLRVSTAGVGVLGDIGLAQVVGTLPQTGDFARTQARKGERVTVVGYPLGGALTVRRGRVVDRVDGGRYNISGAVLRIRAHVQPGSSGGPVLNRRNRVAAVVFGVEIATGLALAIPVDTMVRLLEIGGLEEVPPCGAA